MKIIHTGDWHIGKLVHGIHMTEDQRIALDSLVELLKREKPQVLVIAGDIYDRAIPPVEAVELLDEFLGKVLLDMNIHVLVVAGNHDSPNRLSFGSRILERKGLHIRGYLENVKEPVVIEDEYGKVNFYLLPYLEPALVRHSYDDANIKTHEDAFNRVIEDIKRNMNIDERNVLVTHGYFGGVSDIETSESERPLSIGGSDIVSVNHLEEFDYVALGHIHKPQKVKHDYIRYAGSLLKYSFSEHNQSKGILVVEVGEKQQGASIRKEKLDIVRDLRVIKGEIDELLDEKIYSLGNTKDYIMAVITDKGEVIDAIGKLRGVYPNILRIEREERVRTVESEKTSAGEDFVKKNPEDLFKEFYRDIIGDELAVDQIDVLKDVMEDINRVGRES